MCMSKDCNEVKSRVADILLVTAKVLSNICIWAKQTIIKESKIQVYDAQWLSWSVIVEIQDNKGWKGSSMI